ncbi:hypothetical protein COW36_15245 [bacterium (Candidatus Blackallbacteria) CG17_big_fil_post_rev_8_21_14_2_50_48_46]|uniref:FAD-binding domain-containing protein n=1 Tax=bacterium (Candidatus Blackallbacteria) CG17_big_fil_post_rev_8_21_14_2_50_48_46 TaxID=2014261 RepID=A0A2M7G2V1_9BACT|nr:MAG: hypothetical protein COW64_11305 [bacterium (Candidatus Blackallbacteria) CG18_big_fil_WC_8_21_14_2_50_49_26]PIW16065.1 MAG: hypothetical protein COW36_15245 [bacterium (Candidatus Blackallbacteria) CG17_big_fil_post_rev_8_21_14_2_50_48_46]PIW50477.1 MAG: hypothetical protein COW20_02960 [bacterium (Candidatus Blackallbacteria) CG13_big_fil_rev_8_21_14_2_50_49_14]
MKVDLIITGAGFSGVFCAAELARSGWNVLLLDSRPESELGKPYTSIMLDVDTFSKTGIARPQGDELLHLLDQFYAYSPSGRIKKPIDFSSLLVNGYLLLQRLLAQGKEHALKFVQAKVKAPLIENGAVVGVQTEDGQRFHAPLVIDASGTAQVLGLQLKAGGLALSHHPLTLETDYGLAYRRLCETGLPANELHIYFAVEGGYVWRSPNDIGLGLSYWLEKEEAEARLNHAIQTFDWKIGEVTAEAMGRVPVRYPLTNMVAPGFAAVGDAAFMINSVRGGGISAGLKGARILADVAHEVLSEKRYSQDRLWEYNLRYQREVGAQLAYQDAMRMILMNETSANMEFAFEKDIVTADDIRSSLGGKLLDFSPMQKLQKGLRGAANPGLLLRFNNKLHWAHDLFNHFKAYPETPLEYVQWEDHLHQIQEHLKQ